MSKQIKWDKMYLRWARDLAETHGYDPKFKVGAIVINNESGNIAAIGYNGRGRGRPNERISLETGLSGFVHAEANAIAKASWDYGCTYTLYCTLAPCVVCAGLILNTPVSRVVFSKQYDSDTLGVAELIAGLGKENVVFINDVDCLEM